MKRLSSSNKMSQNVNSIYPRVLGVLSGPMLVAILLTSVGCSEEFDPFNLINKLRVMAVRAEPPSVSPGQTAAIKPLVHVPDDQTAQYRWSWCPIVEGRNTGYRCAVTEAELGQLAEDAIPGGSQSIPPFDLGSGPEASFDYAINPLLLLGICELAKSSDVPAFVGFPHCEGGLPITIRLEISTATESVVAVKELWLSLDPEAEPNANPTLGDVWAALEGGADSAEVVLPADQIGVLQGDRAYALRAEIPESASQTFTPFSIGDTPAPEPRRENLFMSWFVTGGSTDFMRTTFFDGAITLADLAENVWETPRSNQVPGGVVRLFLVIQDERGGVDWTERAVRLEEVAP